MIRTYRYRLYPTPQQVAVLTEILDLARWLYNHALAYRRKRWNESRQNVTYKEQLAMWRDWRNECPNENPLQVINVQTGQRVLRRLDQAYSAFIRGNKGKPRFKSKRAFNSVTYMISNGASFKKHKEKLYIHNVGLITVKWHRPLIPGKPKNVTIKRRPSGWYALVQVECPDITPQPSENPPIGIDMGIHHALALSNGLVADSPQHLKQALKKLRVLQRTVSRRKKGSKSWEEAVHQLARATEHIANQRRDWWHRVVYHLVKNYGVIVLENLNLQFMLRNDKMARAAHDVALGIFDELLHYKAFEAGVQVIKVKSHNTSQRCSQCQCLVPKDLSVRTHQCPHCSFTADRDVNAALNILALGLSSV